MCPGRSRLGVRPERFVALLHGEAEIAGPSCTVASSGHVDFVGGARQVGANAHRGEEFSSVGTLCQLILSS